MTDRDRIIAEWEAADGECRAVPVGERTTALVKRAMTADSEFEVAFPFPLIAALWREHQAAVELRRSHRQHEDGELPGLSIGACPVCADNARALGAAHTEVERVIGKEDAR